MHPSLRKMFYADRYIGEGQTDALRNGASHASVLDDFATLEAVAAQPARWLCADSPTALDFYTAALLRWSALYPTGWGQQWFDLDRYPALRRLCARLEALPCTACLARG